MVATHDMEQTRAWDRVLCLNRRQVAFGPPGDVLTREVLERTYGGSIVVLPSDGEAPAAGVLPAAPSRPRRTDVPLRGRRRSTSCSTRGAAASRAARWSRSLLIGLAAGPLGCWVVLYGLSYSAESLAHAMLPGLVIAALAGFPLDARRRAGSRGRRAGHRPAPARLPTIGADTAVAVVVTSLVGAGALLALSPDSPAGVQELLFGDVLGVSSGELLLAAALAAVVLAALRVAHGQLLTVGFDRANAPAFGASPRAADALLLLLVGGVHRRRRAGARQPAGARDAGRAGRDGAPRDGPAAR